jgi:hypothetical protein
MRAIKVFIFLGLATITIYSCVYNDLSIPQDELKIQLRWVRAYPAEKKEDIVTGLAWDLSFLGAQLSTGALNRAMEWKDGESFILDLSILGFTTEAKIAWQQLIVVLKESEEYKIRGGIDLGRFIMLSLNSANHYYAITGAKKNYQSFRSQFSFDSKQMGFATSTVSIGSRVVEIGRAERFNQIAFVALEGTGSIVDNTFKVSGYEVLDFMPNGQLRFAIYDDKGNLRTSADPNAAIAGKPAKCLWCHEIKLQPNFSNSPSVNGFYTKEEFTQLLAARMSLVDSYRAALNSDIDFTKTQDHTKGELIYLSFMEPSAERLAIEWGITTSEIKEKLKSMATHPHSEFSFLGNELYDRNEIEGFAPYAGVVIPSDSRESSNFEPDLIRF